MNIARCHDLPHVKFYKCTGEEFGITDLLCNKYKYWFETGKNIEQLLLYVKQQTNTILADRPFTLIWLNQSSEHYKV